MSGVRFTAWLSKDERKAQRELAAALGVSDNFVIRTAVRNLLFDIPVPRFVREELHDMRERKRAVGNVHR